MKVTKEATKQKDSSLASRALLVNLSVSQWTARKADEKATNTVVEKHSADLSAGKYNKKLLPDAKELEAVSLAASQIRKYVYEQTLPWMTDGGRILPAKNHMKFSTEFRKMKTEFESAVRVFESAYPRLKKEAEGKLGDLYNEEEYPSRAEISEKFGCEVAYLPLPNEKDFRIQISESEKKDFMRKMKQVENEAMLDCWKRLHTVVEKAAGVLSKPDAIFRDSLLENVTEICALLPSLNISDDAKLEGMRRDVEKLVAGVSADSIRNDKKVRTKAAEKMKDIQDKMSAFMGTAAPKERG